jgi:hypothetical protein
MFLSYLIGDVYSADQGVCSTSVKWSFTDFMILRDELLATMPTPLIPSNDRILNMDGYYWPTPAGHPSCVILAGQYRTLEYEG